MIYYRSPVHVQSECIHVTHAADVHRGKKAKLNRKPPNSSGLGVPLQRCIFGKAAEGMERPLMCEMLAVDIHKRLCSKLGPARFMILPSGPADRVLAVKPLFQGKDADKVLTLGGGEQGTTGFDKWYALDRADVIEGIPDGVYDCDILEDMNEETGQDAYKVYRILHHLAVKVNDQKVRGGLVFFFLVQWAEPYNTEITWEPCCHLIQARDSLIRYRNMVLGLPRDFTFENSVVG